MKNEREIRRMIRNATKVAVERARGLATSGAIDPSVPHYCKAVVCAALTDTARDYMPLCSEGKADVKNLLHF